MPTQKSKAKSFRSLHVPGSPLVLFNAWDAGSAKAVTAAGAKAIATGSWSVAKANGFDDGEDLPLDLALANLSRIVNATSLPVTIDLEKGYGATPAVVGKTIRRSIEAGAVGCNIEDSHSGTGKLRAVADQVRRIAQARKAADATGIAYFINGRTDVFFQKPPEKHDAAMVADALERARLRGRRRRRSLRARPDRRKADGEDRRSLAASGQHHGQQRHAAASRSRQGRHRPGQPRAPPYLLAMKALEEAARAAWA